MAAVKREILNIEAELVASEEECTVYQEKLVGVQRARLSAEEELASQNARLKQILEELISKQGETTEEVAARETMLTRAELDIKVEDALVEVIESKLADEAFASAIVAQSDSATSDKVRVEFGVDEVYWSLSDNYTFDMLQTDASRYFDLSTTDAVLYDEHGAIWPADAYVALELSEHPSAKISLRVKPVAAAADDDVEVYGKEEDVMSDYSEASDEEQDFMKVARAAEDDLLIAQSKGTAATLNSKQRAALRRKLFRETWVFIIFVTLFLYVLYTRRVVTDGYSMQQAVATAFLDEAFGDYNEKTYFDIATAEEMFDWMQGPLVEGLYPAELYNGQEVPDDKKGYVMKYNKVIGQVRLRQVRANKCVSATDGCGACTEFRLVLQKNTRKNGEARQRQFIDYCYPEYDPLFPNKLPFGPTELQLPGSGYVFSTAEDNSLDGLTAGDVGAYDGSGFVRDLSGANRTEYEVVLEELKSNLWVDRETRAVFISLNMYNGNYNYYCQTSFMVEFSTGGTVVPTSQLKIISLDIWDADYWSGANMARSVPEMMLYGFLFGYLVQYTARLVRTKRVTGTVRGHFRDPWNNFDLVVYGLMITSVMLRLMYYLSEERTAFNPFLSSSYQEMGVIASSYTSVFNADAATVLIICFKCLKFFKLQRDLSMMRDTLAQAATDLLVFMGLMLVLLGGFVVMGLNIFGTQAESFKSFAFTAGTIFLILLGEFDYDEMKEVNATFAFIYFVVYVLFMFFIVLNIFIAILNDAYTVVHTNQQWQEDIKRKKLTLREKFEMSRAKWRERKKMAYVRKLRKERLKEAKRKQKDFEKKKVERVHFGRLGHKKRKAAIRAEVDVVDKAKEEGVELKAANRHLKARKHKPWE